MMRKQPRLLAKTGKQITSGIPLLTQRGKLCRDWLQRIQTQTLSRFSKQSRSQRLYFHNHSNNQNQSPLSQSRNQLLKKPHIMRFHLASYNRKLGRKKILSTRSTFKSVGLESNEPRNSTLIQTSEHWPHRWRINDDTMKLAPLILIRLIINFKRFPFCRGWEGRTCLYSLIPSPKWSFPPSFPK